MRSDFCAFILTNRRPDNVQTLSRLRGAGYTGRVILVLDDEDPTIGEYRTNFPEEEILVFSKKGVADRIDVGDNFPDRRSVIYARNACWDLAKEAGVKYFIQLDDDYMSFWYRFGPEGGGDWRIRKTMDALLMALVEFLEDSGCLSVAIAQGGDYIGGTGSTSKEKCKLLRKAMNSFVCCVDRPFDFVSRLNDDVSTYLTLGSTGSLFFTVVQPMLVQAPTQSAPGGLTEAYLDFGTYVKSFYSVMFSPSCVKVINWLSGDGRPGRLHHRINWPVAVPKIIREITS